jgi:prevent-host-death family protein
MVRTVTIDEASAQFTQLLENMIAGGDEVIIAREGTPVARLVPASPQPTRRVPGTAKGEIVVPPEFFEPLPEEIIEAFYNGDRKP